MKNSHKSVIVSLARTTKAKRRYKPLMAAVAWCIKYKQAITKKLILLWLENLK